MQNIVTEIHRSLCSGELAVFCGAGISRNSGLPLANELKRAIIAGVFEGEDAQKHIDAYMNVAIPFEMFIEIIIETGLGVKEESFLDAIADIFGTLAANPNTNHQLIGKLASRGLLKTILTTNFDLLIERALEQEGLIQGQTYTIHHKEMLELFKRDGSVHLFKIHGSVDGDVRVVPMTIYGLADLRRDVLEYVFSSGPHRTVWVLGYSCSDFMDITPLLQEITGERKQILYVNHVETDLTVEQAHWEQGHPFKDYPGLIISGHTDRLVRQVWESVVEEIGPYQGNTSQPARWEGALQAWHEDLKQNEPLRMYRAGRLLADAHQYDRAITYLCQSLKQSGISANGFSFYRRITLADTYLKQGDLAAAIDVVNDLMNLAREASALDFNELIASHLPVDKQIYASVLRKSGIVLRLASNYQEAVERLKEALAIEIAIGFNRAGLDECYENLALCYAALGQFTEAFESCELMIPGKRASPTVEVAYCMAAGFIEHQKGDLTHALEIYEKGLGRAQQIGDLHHVAQFLLHIGDVYERLKMADQALFYYTTCLFFLEQTDARLLKARGYTYLGYLHFALGHYRESIDYHRKSLEAQQVFQIRPGDGIGNMNIGSAYAALGDYRQAIEYYLKAEQILQEARYYPMLNQLYRNLSLAYRRLGDFENAARYSLKTT